MELSFFPHMEEKAYEIMIERRIIRAKGMLMDATVILEAVKYPTDVRLLNDVWECLVISILRLGTASGMKRARIYKRKARKEYLKFAKRKTKPNLRSHTSPLIKSDLGNFPLTWSSTNIV
jgi:IS5 family transposase